MGVASSIADNSDINLQINISSDEVRQCDICKEDLILTFCEHCKKDLCIQCCEHLAKLKNRFYYSNLIPVLTDTLPSTDLEGASQQMVRCGAIGRRGSLALLSQISYQDNTFEWRLCYLRYRHVCVANRQQNENKSFAFPGDICYVGRKDKLYVTVPCKKMVYKLYHYENFREAFSTPLGFCFGITSFNNGLALSVQTSSAFLNSKWQVQFVDMKGHVLQRIQNNPQGLAYFEEPLFLTSNKDKNLLFVSDKEKNAVFAFDINGSLVFHYHGMTIRSPLGIAADKFGNVYVACGKKVVQIEKDGKKSRELHLDIKNSVTDVCMNNHSDTLTIISESGHVVSFQFS